MIEEYTQEVKNDFKRSLIGWAKANELSADEAQKWQDRVDSFDRPVFRIRPYPDDGGIYKGISILNNFHTELSRWAGFKNASKTHGWEMWYHGRGAEGDAADERLTFNLIPETAEQGRHYIDQFYEDYPDTEVRQTHETFVPGAFRDGRAITGARFKMFRPTHYPMENVKLGGFTTEDGDHRDPLKDILTPITRKPKCRVMIQTLFRPVVDNPLRKAGRRIQTLWTSRDLQANNFGVTGELGYNANTGEMNWGVGEVPPRDIEQDAGDIVSNYLNKNLKEVELRVFVSAPTTQMAEDRLEDICRRYRKYYTNDIKQGIYGVPAYTPWIRKGRFNSFVSQVIDRERAGHNRIECSDTELGGLVHLPGDDVNNAAIDQTHSRAGTPVPTGTPRVNFEEHGLDRDLATDHEKQKVMFETLGKGDPIFFGFGARKGTEAGIFEDILDVHAFVNGSTGKGKTQLLLHIWYQLLARGYGGMFFDPKGDDGDKILSYLPYDRDDDEVVYIELGGDQERQPRMNFLEPPTNAPPGTNEFDTAVEAMASDIKALLAEGGDSNMDYWGNLMDRITGNMVRGLARMDENCTFYDMAKAIGSEEGRVAYGDATSDQKIDFIEDYAQQIAGMDDDKVDAISGRLAQWIENPITRRLISSPEATFSMDDVVKEGKIIIVSDKTPEGMSAGKMVATALVRRLWMSIREQMKKGDRPPNFYAILDEYDKIASGNANMATLLSVARSSPLSLIPACQDLTNQVEDEEIMNAILGQCNTFLNLNPRRYGEAQEMARRHSEDIEPSDLTNMSKYVLYMRTHDKNDELTYSYKVNAFSPLDSVVPELVRDEDEVKELKRISGEVYGAERLSNEEIRRASTFDMSVEDATNDGAGLTDEGGDLVTEQLRRKIVMAVHRMCVKQGREEVPAIAVREELEAETEFGGHILSDQIEDVANGDYLNRSRTNEGGADERIKLSVTSDGKEMLLDTGESVTGGREEHRWGVEQTVNRLIKTTGLRMEVIQQDGGEIADAKGVLPVRQGGADYKEAKKRRDELMQDYPLAHRLAGTKPLNVEFESKSLTKPAQVCNNGRKAFEKGRRVLYTVAQGEDGEYADNARRCKEILSGPAFEGDSYTDCSRVFYSGDKLKVAETPAGEDIYALHPAESANLSWVSTDGDDLVLWKGNKGERETVVEYDDVTNFDDREKEEYPALFKKDQQTGDYTVWHDGDTQTYSSKEDLKSDWSVVYKPFIPELELEEIEDGPVEDAYAEQWDIAVVPNDESVPLQHYDPETGELTPLPELVENNTGEDDKSSSSTDEDENSESSSGVSSGITSQLDELRSDD